MKTPSPPVGPAVHSVQRTTRKGTQLRLDHYSRIDDGIKAGWIVDLIEAHARAGPAGYLKISFIPREEMTRQFSTAFEWAIRECGNYPHLRGLIERPESDWTREDLLYALRCTDGFNTPESIYAQRETSTTAALVALWQERRDEIKARYEHAYKRFCDFHQDRPLIDFIRVYDGSDRHGYVGGRRVERDPESHRDYRRRGIATTLHEAGAIWMHERGLALHASDTRSVAAAAVWETFRRRGLVRAVDGVEPPREVIDAEMLVAQDGSWRIDPPNPAMSQ